MHCWVMAVVLRRSSGDADVRFTYIPGTGGLKLASVILLGGAAGPIVVIVALSAPNRRGVSGRLGERDLPLVAHLRGPGVAQDLGAFQCAAGHKARGGGAGDVIHLLAGGGGDVDGKFGAA